MISLLDGISGIRSAVSTCPVDSADYMSGVEWVAESTGLPADRVAMVKQVHGAAVHIAPWHDFPERPVGDAIITDREGFALSVRIADCAPVVIGSRDGKGIGVAHVGWRGAREGIIQSTVDGLCRLVSCKSNALSAAIGPTIGVCCYDVGRELTSYFHSSFLHERGGSLFLDLPGIVAAQLEKRGLDSEYIELRQTYCTVCGRGAPEKVSFHSYRASGGGNGRNVAFIAKDYSN